ncbi:MAG: hypothetical protein IBX62_08940 [Coriobacteriia bacterium]|nr:hypothetical protein [Coriobacteriia bacterium]
MSRSTKLYQQPRSPLIQGRSRIERPSWQPWLVGSASAIALMGLSLAAAWSLAAKRTRDAMLSGAPVNAAVLVAVGALACGLGVRVATGLGVRRRWLMGSVVGYAAMWFAWAARGLWT